MEETETYIEATSQDIFDETLAKNVDEFDGKTLNAWSSSLPDFAKPLVGHADTILSEVRKAIYTAPSFLQAVREIVPEETFQAVLSKDQKKGLASGALKLMTKKDGTALATLINPETNKIVSQVPIEVVKVMPELTEKLANYSTQMQLAQIAERIENVQLAIEEVRQGQESDRLAIAHASQQKLLQAREIQNPALRETLLLQVISDAELSRNQLMLSQQANIQYILNQPRNRFEKMIKSLNNKEIAQRMNEIRVSLGVVNMVSMSETLAYWELGEFQASRVALSYYQDFLEKTYVEHPEILNRLDMLDSRPDNYWSKALPEINDEVKSLTNEPTKLIEMENNKDD